MTGGASNVLSRNRGAQFVSWDQEFTGFDRDTGSQIPGYRRGKYRGSTDTHWLVEIVDGTVIELDKDRWTPCLGR